jgi:hypothetical protein
VLYNRKLYGGRGSRAAALFALSNVNADFNASMLEQDNRGYSELTGQIAMYHLLYRYLNRRRLISFYHRNDAVDAVYDDGTTAHAVLAGRNECYNIISGEILVADQDTRFLPFEDGIYVYSRTGETIKRRLPENYAGEKLTAVPLSAGVPGNSPISMELSGSEVTVSIPANILCRLEPWSETT